MIVFGLRDAVWGQPAIFYLTLFLEAGAGFLLTCCLRLVYRKVARVTGAWGARATAVLVASGIAALIWQPIKNYSQIEQLSELEDLLLFWRLSLFCGCAQLLLRGVPRLERAILWFKVVFKAR